MATLRPGESIEHLLTAEDRATMQRALDAEARGDAGAAWEHQMAGVVVEEALTHHRLLELARLGDEAPAWMCSRWAVDQAGRWMLSNEDPRCDEVVRVVLASLHRYEMEALLHDPKALQEYGTAIAASDWVYSQVAVYECGGLRDFLDVRAEEGLLCRLDRIDEWERAAVTSYELIETTDDVLRARRLSDHEPVDLLNLGAMTDNGPGSTVVGRVVPVSVWPFLMFESRPLPVDRETAEDVSDRMRGEDDLGWLWALTNAYEEGRLPAGSTCGQGTLWSTDIVPEWRRTSGVRDGREGARSGRVQELMAAGLSEHEADGVCVAEVGLIVAEVSGDIGPVAAHVTSVLLDPRVHDALKVHGVGPHRGRWWRIVAAATPSPVRERCLELAELSDRRTA